MLEFHSVATSSYTPTTPMDPMDLIRFEVLRNLDNWLKRLYTHKDFNRLAWIEFGWSAYQLNTRYPHWHFLDEGLFILEAARSRDEEQVVLIGRRMQEHVRAELRQIESKSA